MSDDEPAQTVDTSERERRVWPMTPELARQKFQELGSTIFFEKVLTGSDTRGTGRIVVPKAIAEKHFPAIENPNGIILPLHDVLGQEYTSRYKFWSNNASRMYLFEQVFALTEALNLSSGHVLVFGKGGTPEDPIYHVATRRATREDSGKKSKTKTKPIHAGDDRIKKKRKKKTNNAGGASGSAAGDGSGAGGGEGNSTDAVHQAALRIATATMKQEYKYNPKQKVKPGNGAYEFWGAVSVPPRTDGVFRSLPQPNSKPEANQVSQQHGCYSVVVMLGDELFQAHFESHHAAQAALDAALQSATMA